LALINDPQAIALAKQLLGLYGKVKQTQHGDCVCDICGVSFKDAPSKRKPQQPTRGFGNRLEDSPSLCMSHCIGWGITLQNAMWGHPALDDNDNEQVDLLFAHFLAKQMIKYSNQLRRH
jgi:hypothetical protein